jgi:glycosyltransferase involved in cell wall biosynthesis
LPMLQCARSNGALLACNSRIDALWQTANTGPDGKKMESQPLVSVIMPYYNRPALAREAVESVMAQTYGNWELVIADDASPAPSASELFAHLQPEKIKVVRHDKNLGCAEGRNSAIRQSKGSLIVPLDCDDRIAPTYIEATLKALRERQVDGIYTQVQIFGEQDFLWVPECTMINMMCAVSGPSTFLYKREVYDAAGPYRADLKRHPDAGFWISAFSKGFKFERLDEPLYFYRKHEGESLTSAGRCDEVPELARVHKQLYVDNLEAVLRRLEEKYWQSKDEYQGLQAGFSNVMEHYTQLQKNFEELLENYRALEKSHYLRRFQNFVKANLSGAAPPAQTAPGRSTSEIGSR